MMLDHIQVRCFDICLNFSVYWICEALVNVVIEEGIELCCRLSHQGRVDAALRSLLRMSYEQADHILRASTPGCCFFVSNLDEPQVFTSHGGFLQGWP